MPKTIRNPIIGHSVTFLQTAVQTNGELLQIEYGVERPENKPAIPLHFHQQSSERFEVIQGQLGVVLGGERRLLGVGDNLFIPPGPPHTFWNAGEGKLRFITDVRSPGQLQQYWETVFGLAQDGKVGRNGLPNLLTRLVCRSVGRLKRLRSNFPKQPFSIKQQTTLSCVIHRHPFNLDTPIRKRNTTAEAVAVAVVKWVN